MGSPPRMRGKVNAVCVLAHKAGITPAHAGKSLTIAISAFGVRDHPRACGEKRDAGPLGDSPVGSPPRMRGKVV